MTDYKVFLTSSSKARGLKKTAKPCTIVIEPEDFNKEQVLELKKKGYRVLGYLNIGSIEDTRSYYNQLKPYRIMKDGKPYQLEDWPHEWWIDLRRTKVRDFIVNRAKEVQKVGCDGWWCDNIDIYEYNGGSAMFQAVASVLRRIKALNGYVMLNGGYKWLQEYMNNELNGGAYKVQIGAFGLYDNAVALRHKLALANIKSVIKEYQEKNALLYKVQTGAFSKFSNAYSSLCGILTFGEKGIIKLEGSSFTERPLASFINGVTQEEVFTLITDYDGKGKFKSQHKSQSNEYKEHMQRLKCHGLDTWLLEYSRSATKTKEIKEYCTKYGITGYYVASDVNL